MAPRGCAARANHGRGCPRETRDYRADHVILATGARPRALPGIAPDGEHIWTYFEALRPKLYPSRS